MNKNSFAKPTKSVVDYNTTAPSSFDEKCIKGYKQISFWNRGRKAAQGQELQKDWFNHYTKAILRTQELLELQKIEKEGVKLSKEQIDKRIKKAQWSYMKQVEIPKGYKSKCKKITISSMKYKKPRIPNVPDIDTTKTETIEKPKVPKFVSNYVNKEMVKLEARREELLKEEQIEIERLKQAETKKPIETKKSTSPSMDNMQEQLNNITETLNLVVNHLAKQLEKEKKPKRVIRESYQ